MVTLGDISRKGALPALAELRRVHPRSIGAMEFARASGVDAGTASRARAELHQLGVIHAEVVRSSGAVNEYEIRLTPLGIAVADYILLMAEVIERHERKHGVR